MRKQILVVACIAVVFFLLGTLVSMGLTANGIMPNPFAERTQIQIIRFTKFEEINITGVSGGFMFYQIGQASFIWNPKDSMNNAIMSIYCYFELRCEPKALPSNIRLETGIYISGFESSDFTTNQMANEFQEWKVLCFRVREGSYSPEPNLYPCWIKPNQESYNVTLGIRPHDYFQAPTYVRNINIIMEVIDG
jgi:hypothetical protein